MLTCVICLLCSWVLPSNYFYEDLPVPAGAPSVRAIFVDANPFIEAYNTSKKAQYYTEYFITHVGPHSM